LNISISEFPESNSSLVSSAVREIVVGPKTFDIFWESNVLVSNSICSGLIDAASLVQYEEFVSYTTVSEGLV
jgi:hypothetical protein